MMKIVMREGVQIGIIVGFFSSIAYILIGIVVAILRGYISAPWIFKEETLLSLFQWAIRTFSGTGLLLIIVCAVTGSVFENILTKDNPSREKFVGWCVRFCGLIISPILLCSTVFIFYPVLSGSVSIFHPRVLEMLMWPFLPGIIYFLDGILICNYLYSQTQYELKNVSSPAS